LEKENLQVRKIVEKMLTLQFELKKVLDQPEKVQEK